MRTMPKAGHNEHRICDLRSSKKGPCALMDRLTRALSTGGWMTSTRAAAHIATCADGCSLCGFYANRKAT